MFAPMKAIGLLTLAISFSPVEVTQAQTAVKASGETSALARAIALHDSAVALYSKPSRAAQAARLHIAEVQFRSPSDPEAVDALIMAGNLYSYAKQPFVAKKVLEGAAERAVAMGDVLKAAQAYTSAAFVAHKIGSKSETQRLGRKAVLLSASPLIDVEQRNAIRDRFNADPAFAGVFK